MLSSYFFSDNNFSFKTLKKIPNFSVGDFIDDKKNLKNNLDVAKQWVPTQEKIKERYKKNLFFKTHNACISLNDNLFTNSSISAGCIYIVRDPRNIITSYKNFERKSYDELLSHMMNKESFLFGNENFEKKFDFKGFEFIGSWADNYNSWVKNKLNITIHLVKYEDLIKNPFGELKKMVEFINKINNQEYFKFDLEKAKKSVENSSFKNLSEMETQNGFNEISQARKGTKFFNQGEKNDWRKKLPIGIRETIEKFFQKEMRELDYI